MLDQGLYQFIVAAPSIVAIAGSKGAFGGQAPEQVALPYVVIEQIAGEPIMTMDGPNAMRFARYQFTSHGKTRLQAKQLQRAVRQLLENFVGLLPEGTQIQNMQTEVESDAFEYAPLDYAAPLDVQIAYVDSGS